MFINGNYRISITQIVECVESKNTKKYASELKQWHKYKEKSLCDHLKDTNWKKAP